MCVARRPDKFRNGAIVVPRHEHDIGMPLIARSTIDAVSCGDYKTLGTTVDGRSRADVVFPIGLIVIKDLAIGFREIGDWGCGLRNP